MLLCTGPAMFAEQVPLVVPPVINDTVRYDSATIQLIRPDTLREKQVFADAELHFEPEAKKKSLNWLGRFLDWLFGDSTGGDGDSETFLTIWRILVWLFILGGIGVVIWLLMRSEFSGFIKGKTQQTKFNFSDVDEDITGINFAERIRQALADNDHRLAIRWQYLKQLYLLNERKLISWQSYKTNIDYARELSKSELREGFNNISRDYEYVWYGKYEITAQKYQELEQHFGAFEKGLNHA